MDPFLVLPKPLSPSIHNWICVGLLEGWHRRNIQNVVCFAEPVKAIGVPQKKKKKHVHLQACHPTDSSLTILAYILNVPLVANLGKLPESVCFYSLVSLAPFV